MDDVLRHRIQDCHACPLRDTCTQTVPGRGPKHADVMFIGEAPGYAEDRAGRPFIGPAGQLLDTLLAETKLNRQEHYVSNVVKCRPPGNRTPSAKEVKACLPLILEEIRQVQPKYIVALGGTAFKALAGTKEGITKTRGRVIDPSAVVLAVAPNAKVIGTFHPAAYLHRESPAIRQSIVTDLHHLRRDWKGIKRVTRRVPHHIEILPEDTDGPYDRQEWLDALAPLEGCKIVAADCEWTLAVDGQPETIIKGREIAWPWTPSAELFSLSLSGRTSTGIHSVAASWPPSSEGREVLDDFCARHQLIFHNAMADLIWLRPTELPIQLAGDTMVLAHLLNEEQSLRLESLAMVYAGLDEWKSSLWSERPKDSKTWVELLSYNAADTYATLLLHEALIKAWKMLDEDEQQAIRRLYYRLMLPSIPVFVNMAHRGMPLSLDKVKAAIREQEQILHKHCVELGVRFTTQPKPIKFRKKKGEDKQPDVIPPRRPMTPDEAQKMANSPVQIKAQFSREYRLDLPKTDEMILSKLATEYKAADLILLIRGVRKLLGTYLRPWRDFLLETKDGRLHSVYSVTGSRTGRTTAKLGKGGAINLAPREPWIREMFTAEEGRVIMAPDACLIGNTGVQTIRGVVPIKDVQVGDYVYGIKDGKPVARRVEAVKHIGHRPIVRLDVEPVNQSRKNIDEARTPVFATREHKFLMRDGTYKRVDEMITGDRLWHMTRYLDETNDRYRIYTARHCYMEHRIIAEGLYGNIEDKVVHHDNHDHKDNDPNNLIPVIDTEHRSHHGVSNFTEMTTEQRQAKVQELVDGHKKQLARTGGHHGARNPNFGNLKGAPAVCDYCQTTFYASPSHQQKYCQPSCYHAARRSHEYNHRVLSITDAGSDEVYCIKVEDSHNFMLSNGLVSSNSQIELRVIAWLAPEYTMRRIYNEGGDIHNETASFVMGKRIEDLTKDDRQSGKRLNFGLCFGMGPPKFARQTWLEYRIYISEQEARRQHDLYFVKYQDLVAWHRRVEAVDFKRGWTVTPFGQKRRMLESLEQAINTPIQTVATQIVELCMNILEYIFEEERPDLDTHIVAFIHDSIELDVPDDPDIIAEVTRIVEDLMRHPPTWKLGVPLEDIPVPFEVSTGAGHTWAEVS